MVSTNTPGWQSKRYRVAKISANRATKLLYSTLFGGAGLDEGEGIAADDSGHVYVSGYTGFNQFIRTPKTPFPARTVLAFVKSMV